MLDARRPRTDVTATQGTIAIVREYCCVFFFSVTTCSLWQGYIFLLYIFFHKQNVPRPATLPDIRFS